MVKAMKCRRTDTKTFLVGEHVQGKVTTAHGPVECKGIIIKIIFAKDQLLFEKDVITIKVVESSGGSLDGVQLWFHPDELEHIDDDL